MTMPRPTVPRRMLAAIALGVMFLLLTVPAVSAEIIIDEEFTDVEVTGGTRSSTASAGMTAKTTPVNTITFANIERHGDISYISLALKNDNKLGYIEEGRSERTYTLGNHQDTVIVRIKHTRNLLGQVTATIFDIYPQNWSIDGLSGKQSMVISPSLVPDYTGSYTGGWANDLAWPQSNKADIVGYAPYGFGGGYTIVVSSINEWKNHLTVESTDNGHSYQVDLKREYSDRSYFSTIVLKQDDDIVLSDHNHIDFSHTTLKSQINTINITSPLMNTYSRILGTIDDPDDPGDPSRVMVHIIAQDARNENLLLDAAVEVRDQYDAVVAAGTTSPEGWMVFEYDLPDTLTDEDFDRYYTVSVSLPGWTQKVTNFKFYPAFIPRSGDWIRVEMLPDSSGPADPEKTYIMFFVRDIHANPLERASIEIAGQYWHTNSAGHVAVEVPKNSTTAYTVRKTGHVSISGSAAVGAEGSYVVNIALGPALPDRTPGPGDDPGATPPPRDTRTNEEKGKAVIDLIADNAELIATLAILAAVMGLINLIMPGRRRR